MDDEVIRSGWFIRFLPLLFVAASLRAQAPTGGIVITVTQVTPKQDLTPQTFLNGFRRSVSGQTISYHSSHPDAELALIVRANAEVHSAAWESDTLVDSDRDPFYHFVWLSGLDRAGWGENSIAHKFNLSINGEPWFTFRNYKDPTAPHWHVAGRSGSELSFDSRMTDKFGDLFGYMFLKIPKKEFHAGSPITLQVTGADDGNLEWYMAFQYRFNFTPRIRVEPALMRLENRTTQFLRLSLDNLNAGWALEIDAPGEQPIRQPLNVGANIFRIPIPAVAAETTISVTFTIGDRLANRTMIRVHPVIKRDVYLLSYSHNDIGYTDLQPVVERKQWNNIEEGLRLIRQTRDYPEDARYKWNLEGLWPVEGYLRQASESRRSEFIDAVRSGSIGLNAMYANMLTGLANSVEMSHFTAYARRFSKEYSIPITTALESDVPGFSWGIVSALAQSGVKYFASAPNPFDRIGHTLEAWGDKPFYWASQSGEERVLFWVAGASYASFHEGQLAKLGDEKILKLMRQLDETGYPYEIVQLPYTLGDNGPPDSTLPAFVKDWNERYASPRLRIATHEEMFKEFERRYGAGLTVIHGDFTPYWEDGAASTASETALNRHSVDRLIQGEAMWSMIAPAAYPADEYNSAWKNVVLYDEHTWGASNSISEPDDSTVTGQWTIKQRFALDADSLSGMLAGRVVLAAGGMVGPERKSKPHQIAIDVYNTGSRARTDVVLLTPEESSAGNLVVDEQGRRVPSQRLSTGELALLARYIPPMSGKRFVIKRGKEWSRGTVRVSADSMSNDLLTLHLNPRTGTIESLRWKKSGPEFIDISRGSGLNDYLYVQGTNPDSALRVSNVRLKVKEAGPILGSLLVEADAPGCAGYEAEIRLVSGSSRIEIIDRICKLAVRGKEGVHIAFPFNVPNARIRYDVANAFVEPEENQLAGSCKNFFSVQGCVDISNEEYGLTWVTPDAPLIELGSITAETPWLKLIKPSPAVYSYVMSNYWHTNYKADQSGPVEFRYFLYPHGGFKPAVAARYGIECREPLTAVLAAPSKRPPGSLFRIEPPELLTLSIKPIEEGHAWILYLYNPSDEKQTAVVHWNAAAPVTVLASDISGKILSDTDNNIEMPAHGTSYIRVQRK
jgi:alpha-mannosidase